MWRSKGWECMATVLAGYDGCHGVLCTIRLRSTHLLVFYGDRTQGSRNAHLDVYVQHKKKYDGSTERKLQLSTEHLEDRVVTQYLQHISVHCLCLASSVPGLGSSVFLIYTSYLRAGAFQFREQPTKTYFDYLFFSFCPVSALNITHQMLVVCPPISLNLSAASGSSYLHTCPALADKEAWL